MYSLGGRQHKILRSKKWGGGWNQSLLGLGFGFVGSPETGTFCADYSKQGQSVNSDRKTISLSWEEAVDRPLFSCH